MAKDPLVTTAEFNDIARDWSHDTLKRLLDKVRDLNIVHTGALFRKLKYKLGYDFGEVEKIAYGFPRYGVFVAKGVGKGRPVGSASAKQHARQWFNPVLDDELPKLASRYAEVKADVAVRSIKIK